MMKSLPLLPLLALLAFPLRADHFPADLRIRAVGILRQGLASEEYWPARHAADGMAEAGFARLAATIQLPATEPEREVPPHHELAREGQPEARAAVLAELAGEDDGTRAPAAASLGRWGRPRDLPRLASLLDNPHPETRIRAAQAIVRITNRMLAEDADGDGIPDSIERALGTPPDSAEQLVRFHTAEPQPPGDAHPESLPPDLAGAWFGHVGGDRYLWVYEFAEAVSELRTIFHSYVRMDDDDETGRQDGHARGVDAMYSFVDARNDPRIFTPQLRVREDWPVRGIVAGNRIYVCDDVRIQQVDGHARSEINLLSERYPNPYTDTKTGRGTPRREVLAPLRPDRALPALGFPETEGFQALGPSYAARYDLRYGRGNLPLAITTGEGQGFERHFDGYIRSVAGEDNQWELPLAVSGRYYLAFIGNAVGGGVAGLELSIGEEQLGSVATGTVSAPGTLFVSAPRQFRQGDVLRIRTSERSGRGHFGDFALVQAPPAVPPLFIENLKSALLPPRPGETDDQFVLAWTTNATASCEVELAAGERRERFAVEGGPGVNHRFAVPPAFAVAGTQATIHVPGTPSVSLTLDPSRPDPGSRARQPGTIPLTVAETGTAGRLAWPVTSGVPFPKGALADGSQCRILTPAGQPLPAQFRELARWPDGSVKWLLVDTLVDTRPGRTTALELAYNVAPDRFGGVQVEETGGAVALANGTVSLRLDRRRFEPLAGLADGALEVADADGRVFSSANLPPEEMVVEERGPVRATVRVRGRFADAEGQPWMRYLCRIHLHANQSWARLEVTLENDVTDVLMNRFSRFELPLAIPAGSLEFAPGTGQSLVQDYDHRFLLDGEAREGRAPGYCVAGPLAFAVRDFWQLYPKGFRTDGETLRVQFLPPLPADQYGTDEDRQLEDRLYFWCDEGMYKVRAGTRFTTDLAVQIGGGTPPAAFHEHIQHPLFAAADPAHYCASRAWGDMTPRQEGAFTLYEQNLDRAFGEFLERRENVREYGFFNFGDWYGERTWNWGNGEYDTSFALAIHFLRIGNLRMLRRAEEAVAHNGDIDTTHYDANPNNVGRVFTHCIGHTGGYYPRDFRGMDGFNTGPRDVGHTWTRGQFLLWHLTGNERHREAGEAVARYLATTTLRSPHVGNSRDGGWTLIGILGGYQGTGDPFYLNGARIAVDRILDKQLPNGQWGHFIWECRDEYPQPWGCKPFMTGVILHALSIYDRNQPSERVQGAIRRGADYLWNNTYVEKDHGFIYAEAPRFQDKGGIWTMTLAGDGLAYANRLDPEQRHRERFLEALAHNMQQAGISSFGKGFTQGLCFTVYMLDELHRKGIRNPPPAIVRPGVMMRSRAMLAPGQSQTIRPLLQISGRAPQDCRIEFGGAAATHIDGETSHAWQTNPGLVLGPEITLRAAATPGVVTLPVTLTVGEHRETRELRIETVSPGPRPGAAIGWITGPNDPLARAAEALELPVPAIDDLGQANLNDYGTIVLGAEAHEKDFANCRSHADRLHRWVLGGGTLLVGQLNDGRWLPEFLPYDLLLSNDSTQSGPLAVPGHPLFRGIEASQLAGVVSYDQIEWASPEWQVLMQAENGTPAILEAQYGAGRILVILPSFDRQVPEGNSPASTALIRNFLAGGR